MMKGKIICFCMCLLFVAPILMLSTAVQAGPTLNIEAINGLKQHNPRGVQVVVRNTGDEAATNVAIVIEITGGFIVKHRVAVTTLDSLAPGDAASLRLITFGYSLGKIFSLPKITATASATNTDRVQDSVNAKIIEFFVLIQ